MSEWNTEDQRMAQRRQHDRRASGGMMTLNIDVTPETHVRLQEKARKQGKAFDQYLQELMEHSASPDGAVL